MVPGGSTGFQSLHSRVQLPSPFPTLCPLREIESVGGVSSGSLQSITPVSETVLEMKFKFTLFVETPL